MDVHMTSHPDSDPNCPEKKGPWSPEEDERLRQAVGSSSPRPKWAEIANQVEGRSAKQCRERWEQNLSPRLNKCPINRGEGLYIIEFVDNHGKKWAEIARQLTDRSDNNIKNWYNGMVQKGKTGRGPQEDALRIHFSPEHQMYLANRGRKAPSPTLDPRHPHGYHPYSSNARAGSYPMAAAPYAPGYANHPYSAPPQMHGYPHHAQQSAEHHRLSAPVLPPPGSLAPIHQHQPPTQSLRLPPLQSPAATGSPHHGHEQRPDYFGQPDWHSRGLTVQTSLQSEHSQASSSSSSSHMSTVSPTSRGRAESQELPTLSGSTASTPLGGSPLTPALPQSEVYRHRRSSRTSSNMDYDPSPKEAAKPTMADQGKKMSIMNLVN